MTIATVLLAAGRARRFGSDKLMAPLSGQPVLAHVIDTVSKIDAKRVAVVGPDDTARRALLENAGFCIAINPDPDQGQSSSLSIGLEQLGNVSGALVLLADMPFVTSDLITNVIGDVEHPALCQGDNFLSPPAFIPARLFQSVKAGLGDRGAAALLKRDPALRLIDVAPALLRDIDQPADLLEGVS